jgi:hypothetical protein
VAWTVEDGWVWVFDLVDHYTAEAWAHVAKVGDRFAALQPVYDAVIDRHGTPAPDVARGLRCATTGDRSTVPSTSPDPSPGWASPTHRRSPANPNAPFKGVSVKDRRLGRSANTLRRGKRPAPGSRKTSSGISCTDGALTETS